MHGGVYESNPQIGAVSNSNRVCLPPSKIILSIGTYLSVTTPPACDSRIGGYASYCDPISIHDF
jgi:hypothetical protein